jgi:hypothetical protein
MNNECDELIKQAKIAFEQEKGKGVNKMKLIFDEKVLPNFPTATLWEWSANHFKVKICGHTFTSYFINKDSLFPEYKGLTQDFPYSDGNRKLINTLADFGEYLEFYDATILRIKENIKRNEVKPSKVARWWKFWK